MTDGEFAKLVAERSAAGRAQLAQLTRALIHKRAPGLLARLDVADPRTFLEPCLFSYFHHGSPSVPLEQLLFGHMSEDRKLDEITVVSDEYGAVYLPDMGYLYTEQPGRSLTLSWGGALSESWLRDRGAWVPFTVRGIDRIPDTDIEVHRACPALFWELFHDPEGRSMAVEVVEITRTKRALVGDACAVIAELFDDYFAALVANIRGLLVYAGTHPYSFATLGAHGVGFLRARPQSSLVFFVEDIIHQCGHVIFSAMTLERDELLAVDPSTPLSAVSELDDYHGGVYEAFHGLFTQVHINRCLQTWRESRPLSAAHAHELHGRISDDMKRFASAIHALDKRALYTDLGWQLFSYFKDRFVRLYGEQRELIERYDTSDQPYIFDYERFLARNPMPEAPP